MKASADILAIDRKIENGRAALESFSEPEIPRAVSLCDADGRPRPQTAALIDIGCQHRLFSTPDGVAFAAVPGVPSVIQVESTEYRKLLGREFYQLSGKGANRNSLADAISTLAARAEVDGDTEPVFLRCAPTPGGLVIDIGDSTGDAIIVDADDWRIAPAPVRFRRTGHAQALCRPERAQDAPGALSRLWQHVNVDPGDRVLVAAWLLSALRPRGPYPILLLIGEQGSGKSSTSRALKRLADNSSSLLRAPPRDTRDLLVGALGSWVLSLDNLSGSNPELSDSLCRISTGGAIAERRLYTNSDEVLIEIQRPMILNGIEDSASRPDLADRCLHLMLPELATQRTEADIERDFARDAPVILGALLDGLAAAVAGHKAVTIPGRVPRMVDFTYWCAAGLPALGFSAEDFLSAYRRNRDEMQDTAIEASPVASALVSFMDGRERWQGSGAELLNRLASVGDSASQAWPRSAKGLLGTLRRLAPALRAQGIRWTHQRTERARLVEVCRVGNQASDVSDASLQGHPADASDASAAGDVSDASAKTRATDASDAYDASKPTLHACPRCLGDGCGWCRAGGARHG